MLVLGVTGQSGAGKGELCAILKSMGYECLDTDITAREVVEKGSECLRILTEHFGEMILLDDGSMNRKKVAEIVFSDSKELEFLTRTTHRYITEKIKEWLFDREMTGDRIVVIDAPQLFDAGADDYCNFTLAVLADKKTRVSRIIARDGITEKEALLRVNAQKSDEFFKSRCDYCIHNDGSLEELRTDAQKLVCELLSKKEYFEYDTFASDFEGVCRVFEKHIRQPKQGKELPLK